MPRDYRFINTNHPTIAVTKEARTQIRSFAALSGYSSMFEAIPAGRQWRSRRGVRRTLSRTSQASSSRTGSVASIDGDVFQISNPALQHLNSFVPSLPTPEQSPDEEETLSMHPLASKPFWSLSFPELPFMTPTFRHYTSCIIPIIAALDNAQTASLLETLDTCIEEPALFYATVAFTVRHLSNTPNSVIKQADVLWLNLKSITSINEALRDHKRATSEPLILAIFILASLERIYGAIESHNAHIKAAQQLVMLRGGLWNLNPTVSQNICFVDRVLMLFTGSRLYLTGESSQEISNVPMESPAMEDSIILPPLLYSPLFPTTPSGLSKMEFSSDLESILAYFLHINDFLSTIHSDCVTLYSLTELRDKLALMEAHILAHAPKYNTRTMQRPLSDSLIQCVLLSLLSLTYSLSTIYDSYASTYDAEHERISKTVSRLCRSLCSSKTHSDDTIWVLFVTGMVSSGSTRRHIRIILARLCREHHLTTWHQVRSLLMEFVYMGQLFDEEYMQLWEEVTTVSDGELEDASTEGLVEEKIWISWLPVISPQLREGWNISGG